MKTTLRLVIEKFSTLRQTPTLTKKEIVFEITLQLNVEVTFARNKRCRVITTKPSWLVNFPTILDLTPGLISISKWNDNKQQIMSWKHLIEIYSLRT